jgi:hypothetical protein
MYNAKHLSRSIFDKAACVSKARGSLLSGSKRSFGADSSGLKLYSKMFEKSNIVEQILPRRIETAQQLEAHFPYLFRS